MPRMSARGYVSRPVFSVRGQVPNGLADDLRGSGQRRRSSLFAPGGLFAEDRFAGVPPVTFFEDGLWDNGLTAFLGFSFLIGTDTHYGWARLNIEETSNIITVYDVAYESTARASIRAGSVPEPGSLALAAIGFAALMKRQRSASRPS